MKIIKKYTAMRIGTETVNDAVEVKLEYGEIEGPYYSQTNPKEEFDTEEEAIEWAFNHCKYSRWIIVQMVKFDYID